MHQGSSVVALVYYLLDLHIYNCNHEINLQFAIMVISQLKPVHTVKRMFTD